MSKEGLTLMKILEGTNSILSKKIHIMALIIITVTLTSLHFLIIPDVSNWIVTALTAPSMYIFTMTLLHIYRKRELNAIEIIVGMIIAVSACVLVWIIINQVLVSVIKN